jgi:hypothetical protein
MPASTPTMKTPARALLFLFVGLSMAGCTTRTARNQNPPVTKVASWGEQPLTARDYWLMREFDDRIDRARGMK